ncbi:MAG: hypothetical protein EOM69_04445 [Clostridia bacterium]|nr:hypothetical protein [Clostridia bacterium]
MFSEKFDLLMNITKTRNNVLAHAVSLDASHVSRLRRGGRALPKNKGFLEAMSRFLARQIATDTQRSLVCEALGAAGWPADEESAAQLLYDWLSSDEASNASVAHILRRFSSPSGLDPAALRSVPLSGDRSPYYYGPEGKRQAVLRFLAAVSDAPAPQMLLLFSEEDMAWLLEDAVFAKKWATLLIGALLRGNRVRIIHTVSRNIGEMLEAVARWIPVYMTNMIEPYYYPKPRDGVFQRTLFLAPETAAVVSTSVGQDAHGMLHFFVEDPAALAALTRDFNNYLALCRPLMRIFGSDNADSFWAHYHEFEAVEAETIVLRPGLSVLTMPDQVLESMSARAKGSLLPAMHKSGQAALRRITAWHRFTELLTLPTEEQLAGGQIPLPLSGPLRAPRLRYTREEYRLHLLNVLSLMERHENYRALIWSGDIPGLFLCGKAGAGSDAGVRRLA